MDGEESKSQLSENPGGSGGESEYGYRSPAKEARLEQLAIEKGWPSPSPEIKLAIVNRQATIAINPESTPRECTAATRALLEVEKVNIALNPPMQTHGHLHAEISDDGSIQIIQDEDWFGNANRLPAQANGSPGTDPIEPEAIQDNGQRPPLGQNGNGHHSGS